MPATPPLRPFVDMAGGQPGCPGSAAMGRDVGVGGEYLVLSYGAQCAPRFRT